MTMNRWCCWLATCGALTFGIAGNVFAGQTSPRTTVHHVTSTGCLEQAAAAPTGTSATVSSSRAFVLTNAVTVAPDLDQRTGFSSAKATIPNRVESRIDTLDQYGLNVGREDAVRHVGQKVAITGTIRGSQLNVHTIRLISSGCQ